MEYLQLAFNVLILLFWVRLWSAPANEFYFNPFLSGTVRLTDTAVAFLRPVLSLPERVSCLLVLLVAVVLKTLLVGRLGGTWSLAIGNAYVFAAPPVVDNWAPHFLFSALHTTAFLFRLWSVFFLVRLISSTQRATRAAEAFAYFTRPFSGLPFFAQPLALFALHTGLVFALTQAGTLSTPPLLGQSATPVAASPFLTGPLLSQLLKTCWLGAMSCADGLALLTRTLLFAIIGNFGASILHAQGVMIICHETVELLLGRFARTRGATAVGLDFTPLIFFFVANMLYDGLRSTLFKMIESSLFN
jgi:hypothetical protein